MRIWPAGWASVKPKLACTERSLPIAPCLSSSTSAPVCGWNQYGYDSSSITRWARAASNIVRASARPSASGFSHNTCLPCCAARTAHAACRLFGKGR